MEKIKNGAKTAFVEELLKQGVEVSQMSLAHYANNIDGRLYSTRLGGIIFELRKKYNIATKRVPNLGSHGTHAVYYLEK